MTRSTSVGRSSRASRFDGLRARRDDIRRAFREFLTLPTAVIAAFMLLAIASYALDRTRPEILESLRGLLRSHIFADAERRATS